MIGGLGGHLGRKCDGEPGMIVLWRGLTRLYEDVEMLLACKQLGRINSSSSMQYCGRHFDASEVELIRELIAQQPPLNRCRRSRAVCERLNWRRPDGRLKDMSCRVAMLRMKAEGLFSLPQPRRARLPAFKMSAALERAILASESLFH